MTQQECNKLVAKHARLVRKYENEAERAGIDDWEDAGYDKATAEIGGYEVLCYALENGD